LFERTPTSNTQTPSICDTSQANGFSSINNNQTAHQSALLLSQQQQQLQQQQQSSHAHRIAQAQLASTSNNTDAVPQSSITSSKSTHNTANKIESVSPIKQYSQAVPTNASSTLLHDSISTKITLATNIDINNNSNNNNNLTLKNDNNLLGTSLQNNSSILNRSASAHNTNSSILSPSQQLKQNNALRNPNVNSSIQHLNQANSQHTIISNNADLRSTSLSPSISSYTRTQTPTHDHNATLMNSCKRPRLQLNDDESSTWIASNPS
jgi:hypothetical protein